MPDKSEVLYVRMTVPAKSRLVRGWKKACRERIEAPSLSAFVRELLHEALEQPESEDDHG